MKAEKKLKGLWVFFLVFYYSLVCLPILSFAQQSAERTAGVGSEHQIETPLKILAVLSDGRSVKLRLEGYDLSGHKNAEKHEVPQFCVGGKQDR
ncbi:MAG: hypothetical protein ACREBU_09440 [Nitrososphaera sp.]